MKIKCTIEGITPLLMNRFTEKNEVQVSGGTSATFQGSKGTPREQAASRCYADQKGNLFIPGPNVFSSLVAAGAFHKAGKSKLTTMRSSLIPAGIIIEDMICALNTKEWEVDSRSVVIPSTGGRIMCHRPRIDHWALTFTMDVDETMFDQRLVRAVVDDAGRKIGLGDYRPARKGPFGRFVVKNWQVIPDHVKR